MSYRFVLIICLLIVGPAAAADPDNDRIQQAVERGVRWLKHAQAANGTWPTHHVGATALVGLTLLESETLATDPSIARAARYLRKVWPEIGDVHMTYAISLAILFFDRLGDPADEPIIQGLAVRLLAGQNGSGGWSYGCPPLGPDDIRQMRTLMSRQAELKARKPAERSANPGDRPPLPKEVQRLLDRVEQMPSAGPGRLDARIGAGGDNSNTQFAILALWAARRHGIPVEKALARTEARFRGTQQADGGWSYMPGLANLPGVGGSTPSMTCAGLLGLALAYGSAREASLRTAARLPSGEPVATPPLLVPERDPVIRAGFAALARVIGQPLDDAALGGVNLSDMNYLLWSVERVGVAYDLPAIGGRDWYAWGAAILLAAQQGDGSWRGKFGTDIDTSFALLFLRRANLNRDLTAYLKGGSPFEAALKSSSTKGTQTQSPNPAPDRARDARTPPRSTGSPVAAVSPATPKNPSLLPSGESEAGSLKAAFLKASGAEQQKLLDQLKHAKGVAYTDALAGAISQLSGPIKNMAREALAQRLARMTPATLRDKLRDSTPEIRRAAVLACALQEDRQYISDLLQLLDDSEALVARAAHAALKELTGQDLSAGSPRETSAAWKEWWKKQIAIPGRDRK